VLGSAVRRATTDWQVDGQECGQASRLGQGRAVACGDRCGGCRWAGPALEDRRSWHGRPVRMARTLRRTTPKSPVRVAGGRTRLLPADWAPGGHQCPEELPRPSRVSLERVLVLRPEGRLTSPPQRRVAPPTAQRFAVRTRRPFWQELQPGFPGPTMSAPRGAAESRRRPGARQGDVSAGHTRMPSS
jgi:hypothetical protein